MRPCSRTIRSLFFAAMLLAPACDESGLDASPASDVAARAADAAEREAIGGMDQVLSPEDSSERNAVLEVYRGIQRSVGTRAGTEAPRYLFDPAELQEMANLGAGLPLGERWEVIRQELALRYPGKIAETLHWTFNDAGNLVCEIAMLYASPVEYVAFFGTPIGATGFSGRYQKADVWDLMVDGEMWTYVPGQFERTVYHGGDTAYLEKGSGKGVAYVDHAWMIDYGRGNILTMFPFGVIAPALFTTLDYQSALEQFTDYAKLVIQNLLHP